MRRFVWVWMSVPPSCGAMLILVPMAVWKPNNFCGWQHSYCGFWEGCHWVKLHQERFLIKRFSLIWLIFYFPGRRIRVLSFIKTRVEICCYCSDSLLLFSLLLFVSLLIHGGGWPVSGDSQAGSLGRFLTLPVMLCNVRLNWTQLEHIPLHIFFPFGKHRHQRNHFFHSALQAWVSPTSSDWSWRPWPESRCPCCALTSWTIWAAAVSALWCTLRMELSMKRTLTSLLPSWGRCAAARTWAEKASKIQALFTCFFWLN